jgi:hypothetical protein
MNLNSDPMAAAEREARRLDLHGDEAQERILREVDVKYPHVKVRLVGTDGNAFAVLGAVLRAMRNAGLAESVRSEFSAEATSGDYNHLLGTCMRWVDVS